MLINMNIWSYSLGSILFLISFQCFPPKFARSVSYLTDREISLEDSYGRQWMATVCNYNGSLAIRQGWDKFSAEHDLKVGEFLVFHYVSDDLNFIVQIFGTSGCEKIKFSCNIGKEKPKERTYQEITTTEECQSGKLFVHKFFRVILFL